MGSIEIRATCQLQIANIYRTLPFYGLLQRLSPYIGIELLSGLPSALINPILLDLPCGYKASGFIAVLQMKIVTIILAK